MTKKDYHRVFLSFLVGFIDVDEELFYSLPFPVSATSKSKGSASSFVAVAPLVSSKIVKSISYHLPS